MKYIISWETCFCESDFPDAMGTDIIEAESEKEAVQIAHKKHYHSVAWCEGIAEE